jgi:capsular polysaccharide biosynthesis protein
MQQTTEIDLREFGRALLKRLWLIALCAALAGALLLVYTVNFVTPMYSATVSFYVNNNTQSGSGGVASTDLAVALRLANSYVDLVKRNTVLEDVIEQGQLDMTPKQIRSMLTAKTGEETEIFEVTITTPNPQMSADVANAIALYAPDAIHEIIEGSSAKVIDYAEVPMTQSSPNYLVNTLLGGAIGAVLAIVFIFVQMRLDIRIKSEEDLQKICPVPVLGVVPELADAAQTVKKVRR